MPLKNKIWWSYIHEDLQELLLQSNLLLKKVEKWDQKFHDWAFVVFPAAKAYEGFLKTLFLDLGFISEEDYYGRLFRIGKALNPAIKHSNGGGKNVYYQLVDFCNGRELADELWETWRKARNLLFHWFPNERNAITLDEAKERVDAIIESIDLSFKECKIERT